MIRRAFAGAISIAGCVLLTAGTVTSQGQGQKSVNLPETTLAAEKTLHALPEYGKVPVSFIPNRGQMDERVDYYIPGKDKTIYFGAEGVTFALAPSHKEKSRWIVKLDFLGANPGLRPIGASETGTVISYFRGTPDKWKTGLAAQSRVVYPDLWPGIDLAYCGTTDALKYEFIVHPGADPSQIRLAYRGARSVEIDEEGRLAVSTPAGGFKDGTPVAYQEKSGERSPISLAYKIEPAEEAASQDKASGESAVVYGFSIGAYDPTIPLVLDPVILVYCGYIGGSNLDYTSSIAVDAAGSAYVTGYTYSPADFPASSGAGPDRSFNGGNVDAFVAKLNPSGTALEYCGFIGGSGNDYGYGIALDAAGNAYITGYTTSAGATFPVAIGPDLTSNGLTDAFVAKVNPQGTALSYCGFIGGAGQDYGKSIAVDPAGRAYIAGSTTSEASTFPVAVGPQLVFNGGQDAFVARVNADGTALSYCGYIGGSDEDAGTGVSVDASGNAYVVGQTNSPQSGAVVFPVVIGPNPVYSGGFDVFVAEVHTETAELIYCGYIGGTANDYGSGIAVDASGFAYVTGHTASTSSSFPVLGGPSLSHSGGIYDAFVAKVSVGGVSLAYCGYIGGADYDAGTAIAVDSRGYATVTGYTSSPEDSFPVKIGPGLTHSRSFDVFVAKVDATGLELGYCGYVGGSDADLGTSVALGPPTSGLAYLAGNTYSTEITFPVAVGPDLAQNGGRDGFAAKLSENSITLTSPNGSEVWNVGFTNDLTWISDGQVGDVRIEFSTDSGETWTVITDATANDGTFSWIVPDAVSTTCRVRVSEADDGDPSDVSRAAFEITNEPVLVLTAPNGGEKWKVGSTQTITWLSGGEVGDVMIEISRDGGSTYATIVDATENDGSYEWIVSDPPSDTCWIRISEAADGIPDDYGKSVFSIWSDQVLVLTAPNGGEKWRVGSTQTIPWLSGGEVGDVKIEISTDDGATYTTIVDAAENDGSYEWIVPDTASDTCLIRISEAADGFPTDASDAVFSIVSGQVRPPAKSVPAKVIKSTGKNAVRVEGGSK